MLDSPSPRSFVQEPDTDLEVVLEKKGNMDEAHIDQVPSAPPPPPRVATPAYRGTGSRPHAPGLQRPPQRVCHTCSGRERWPVPLHAGVGWGAIRSLRSPG